MTESNQSTKKVMYGIHFIKKASPSFISLRENRSRLCFIGSQRESRHMADVHQEEVIV